MTGPAYLFSRRTGVWRGIVGKLQSAPGLAVFLDYDGTLTPIVKTPSAALLAPETKSILRHLARLPDVHAAIVTGRSMDDIKKLVRIEGVGLAANHGFEIGEKGMRWRYPLDALERTLMSRVFRALRTAHSRVPGALVESKGCTLSVHYRNVPREYLRSARSEAASIVRSLAPSLRMTRGKKVLEVRPHVEWGKGHAVLRMLRSAKGSRRFLPIFIGDDLTDEDGFRMLGPPAITIRVGYRASTKARYYVRGVGEVLLLLQTIIGLRKEAFPESRSPRRK